LIRAFEVQNAKLGHERKEKPGRVQKSIYARNLPCN
jgi:hypothetical protein